VIIGRLSRIWRFPTKSLKGESLAEVDVDEDGVRGDRTNAFFLSSEGQARTGKTYRGKENDRLHLIGDPGAVPALAAEKSLVVDYRGGQRFFDDAPISLLLDRWLEALSAHVGYAVEPIRFRPNFFVTASPGFDAAERDLQGRVLELGAVKLQVRYPIERCVVPNYDPNGGEADARILRFIAQQRATWMGVFCDVLVPGIVRVGDTLASH